MKHAIMILAHDNFEMLCHMIDYYKDDFYVLIHIDKKAKIDRVLLAELKSKPQVVRVYQKFSIHWGGFSMLKCELFLMQEAISLTNADYFHLISGQDYPIKPVSEFKKFFEQRNGWEFVSYVHLPHKNFKTTPMTGCVTIFHTTGLLTKRRLQNMLVCCLNGKRNTISRGMYLIA